MSTNKTITLSAETCHQVQISLTRTRIYFEQRILATDSTELHATLRASLDSVTLAEAEFTAQVAA